MPRQVIIDGNNLLHAMHEHAPLPHVGRETVVRIVDHWARRGSDDVVLVFDGSRPAGGLGKQFSSSRIDVRFSAPQSADDVIVRMIEHARTPDQVLIVSGDKAIRHAAAHRRCRCAAMREFIREVCNDRERDTPSPGSSPEEKPSSVSPKEREEWLELFESDSDEDS